MCVRFIKVRVSGDFPHMNFGFYTHLILVCDSGPGFAECTDYAGKTVPDGHVQRCVLVLINNIKKLRKNVANKKKKHKNLVLKV